MYIFDDKTIIYRFCSSNSLSQWFSSKHASLSSTIFIANPCFLFIISQKIFVMPNMDDVWLPIMHSAMDARSNANLFTVTNDALKDPEPESDVSDM